VEQQMHSQGEQHAQCWNPCKS